MYCCDTIVSLVTPFVKSSVGIIRISGKKSSLVAKKILKIVPKPRLASYLSFFNLSNKIIDKGIAIWFPKPNSFTGEDVLELQAHGNPILLNLLIDIIISIKGVRVAKKGEFSERAFINNKISLLQAEAIDDLIQAKSKISLNYAVKSLEGDFSKYINKIFKKITNFRSEIEARIDFLYDDEKYFNSCNIIKKINNLIKYFKKIVQFSKNSKLIDNGVKVILLGAPNVGKSSLFNVLLKNNRAIVTNIEGTTRDIINENIYINDFLFELIDTAGIRITDNKIENIGIKKTLLKVKNSDFIFFIIDSVKNYFKQINIIKKFLNFALIKKKIFFIINKCDLLSRKIINFYKFKNKKNVYISTLTGYGIKDLVRLLENKINFSTNFEGFLIRNRHVFIVKNIIRILKKSLKNWIIMKNIELLAENLILVQKNLQKIDGKNYSKEVISNIFSNFCIGK